MSETTTSRAVAILGGGASGCLAAVHLAHAAAALGRDLRVHVVEPGVIGRGVAYSTSDPTHRLNVPADNMSAFPHQPRHFLDWLRVTTPEFPAEAFAPRERYGQYLAHCYDAASRLDDRVQLSQVRDRAVDVRVDETGTTVVLAGGTELAVDAVVLANGYGAPSAGWAPAELRESSCFFADPWRADLGQLPPGAHVVLVGAGLTMVDMATRWGRDDVTLHVVSRSGMLPLPHTERKPCAPPPALPVGPLTVAALRRMMFEHIRATGDWRAAADSLRPVTAQLWGRLDADERRRFARGAARRWDRVRHRIDPEIDSVLQRQADAGRLVSHTGSIAAARPLPAGVEVELTGGAVIAAAAVVNCTGASSDVAHAADPLWRSLLAAELVRPGPLNQGLAGDADGRVNPDAPLWTLGPLRRGELWESVAVPEIRCQAAALAATLLSA